MTTLRILVAILLVTALAGVAGAEGDRGHDGGHFEQLGHEPLFNRGMNAALAVHGDYAYVGSRTDGKVDNLTRGGLMIVDVSDPTAPFVAREMGPPLEGNPGESTRELRVWKSQEILIVLHTNCGGATAHLCSTSSVEDFRFYDISGDNAADPQPILTFDPPRNAHEFYLWEDPADPDRALLFVGPGNRRMQVYDISPVADGDEPIALADVSTGAPQGGLHSLSVSNDGTRAYFAQLTGGFAVADTSDFAAGVADPQLRLITPVEDQPRWSGPGAHSAVKLWGSDWVLVADEVYSNVTTSSGRGCPWGWVRMIDASDPTAPTVEAEYKTRQNEASFCQEDPTHLASSFTAHNPTLTPNLALVTWHSSGLQAIDLSDPANPTQAAEFMPEPLPYVVTEDPRLSSGQDKVVMWSFPIIQDGLIYVADLRNGLYILRYTGPHAEEIDDITFLEGNSNIGHALCYEPVGEAPAYC